MKPQHLVTASGELDVDDDGPKISERLLESTTLICVCRGKDTDLMMPLLCEAHIIASVTTLCALVNGDRALASMAVVVTARTDRESCLMLRTWSVLAV
jgi:hypothetical protein